MWVNDVNRNSVTSIQDGQPSQVPSNKGARQSPSACRATGVFARILDANFPPTLHEDILSATGISLEHNCPHADLRPSAGGDRELPSPGLASTVALVEFLNVVADILGVVGILLIVAATVAVVAILIIFSDLIRRPRRDLAEQPLPFVPTVADEAEAWLRRQVKSED
jgi:hypothetical protein